MKTRPDHSFLDHTADLAVEIVAPTLEGLFAEAVVAFADCLTEPAGIEERQEERIELASGSAEDLLVEWLEELLFRFEVDSLLFRRAEITLDEREGEVALRARIRGETYDPDRHPLRTLIKGVTYHDLEIIRSDAGWRARVIFDI